MIFEGHFIEVEVGGWVVDAWMTTKVKHKLNNAESTARTAKTNMV